MYSGLMTKCMCGEIADEDTVYCTDAMNDMNDDADIPAECVNQADMAVLMAGGEGMDMNALSAPCLAVLMAQNDDVVFTDCAGTEFTEELCDEVGGDWASTCNELLAWSGDPYCDDEMPDFNCEAFGFDSGARSDDEYEYGEYGGDDQYGEYDGDDQYGEYECGLDACVCECLDEMSIHEADFLPGLHPLVSPDCDNQGPVLECLTKVGSCTDDVLERYGGRKYLEAKRSCACDDENCIHVDGYKIEEENLMSKDDFKCDTATLNSVMLGYCADAPKAPKWYNELVDSHGDGGYGYGSEDGGDYGYGSGSGSAQNDDGGDGSINMDDLSGPCLAALAQHNDDNAAGRCVHPPPHTHTHAHTRLAHH
jgi:hypothetical protein